MSSDSARAIVGLVALEQVGDPVQQGAALAGRGAAATGRRRRPRARPRWRRAVSSAPASSTSATSVPSAGQRISRRPPAGRARPRPVDVELRHATSASRPDVAHAQRHAVLLPQWSRILQHGVTPPSTAGHRTASRRVSVKRPSSRIPRPSRYRDLVRGVDHERGRPPRPAALGEPEGRAGDTHRGDHVAVRVADRRGDGGQSDLELVDGDGVPLLADRRRARARSRAAVVIVSAV